MIARLLAALGLAAFAPALWADALTGDVQRQPLNVSAIVMFVAFVGATLCITYWASKRNRSAADYYAAGGRITGFQNGLAIAGDYMSAASFLGISALVFTSGYDGLIYSIGFLVGWPIILFLIAERLRNLGKYTFADVASYRLKQKQIRTLSACGSLVVVAFYLIAQMVGAGKLIELLFGLNYHVAVVLVGILMVLYVLFGGMLATTWVQIIKAVLLLSGASFMAIMVLKHVNFDVSTLFSEAIKVHPKGEAIMSPGGLVKDPISAFSLGFALMFGTAGLPHILMRFFTVSDAKEARKSVFYATGFIGYFYILTFIIGFGAILLVSTNPDFKDATGALIGGNNMAAVHLADAVGGSLFLGFISAVAFATILAVVAGLTLAVPLVCLGSIYPLENQELTPLFGQPDWFLGILPSQAGNLKVLDTARWVMPERYRDDYRDGLKYVISVQGYEWGLAVHQVSRSIRLDPAEVKWRSQRSQRPWLAGTVIEHMCALLDVAALAELIASGAVKRLHGDH